VKKEKEEEEEERARFRQRNKKVAELQLHFVPEKQQRRGYRRRQLRAERLG